VNDAPSHLFVTLLTATNGRVSVQVLTVIDVRLALTAGDIGLVPSEPPSVDVVHVTLPAGPPSRRHEVPNLSDPLNELPVATVVPDSVFIVVAGAPGAMPPNAATAQRDEDPAATHRS
jgi:hypothetical protein